MTRRDLRRGELQRLLPPHGSAGEARPGPPRAAEELPPDRLSKGAKRAVHPAACPPEPALLRFTFSQDIRGSLAHRDCEGCTALSAALHALYSDPPGSSTPRRKTCPQCPPAEEGSSVPGCGDLGLFECRAAGAGGSSERGAAASGKALCLGFRPAAASRPGGGGDRRASWGHASSAGLHWAEVLAGGPKTCHNLLLSACQYLSRRPALHHLLYLPERAGPLRSPSSYSSDELSPGEPLTPPPWAPLGAPERPEHLLDRVLERLAGGATRDSGASDILLDDIVLTHSLFLPTEKFLQALHQYFVRAGGLEDPEGLGRKQACLAMLLHFLDTYQGLLQEEEGAGHIIKDLYLLIMKDESLYQDLREDTLRLHQLVETAELKTPEESQPPSRQVKPLFRHFRRIDSCLQTRVAFRGSDEIFCRVYMPDHSYVTIRSRLSASVQDILGSVTEKLQYSEEPAGREEALILVAVASSGEKVLLQPNEDCVFTTLGINSHLFACTRDSYEALVPLPEEIQVSPGDTEIHRVEPEDVANHLTAFHWELFRCVHELEFVDYVFHGERGRRETANLELLLQRCSEVTHWVATEVLLCEAPGKRAQLLKKFIKIAAICKQNQDLLSFYAVVMGLDNAAVSRLRLTWEKLPGKFKNLFRKFENLTDPCRNHKSYREVLSKMKPPVIPFVPLILKDLTFLHEGSKTLVDGLVNLEKLHSVAEKVRTIRKYRSRPLCLDMEASPHHLQTKAYVRQFQVIDNQNLLFDLSYKLEASGQ
ncbi:PREDICTED: rap guanine nucleotide exchange factor-like 1 [Chinchilla lanigera]|uniref:rap guanine nucleotide exchange factor-like 1 n=1 Tax=Chinchilla lanigera TaxID=34839 RepID=UPI000695F80C|nr:PREDICTED: rap guanine nucleotide exchange factor-like 1 [Chinchilla lanigera]